MKKAIIIIPTYNEKGNIETLLTAFADVFKRIPKHWQLGVLFVDDNSPDGTALEIERVAARYARRRTGLTKQNIHIYHNPLKQGLGKAYLLGMSYAFDVLKAKAVFQFDADMSHDPTKIPEMLVKLDQGNDFVLGSRYVSGGSIPADWGWERKFLSMVGNQVIRFGLGHPHIHDWTTGYRLFTKKVYTTVLPQLNDTSLHGYTIMIGFLHATVKSGARVAEVPFDFVDRTYGESKLGVEYIINTLAYIAKAHYQKLTQPLTYLWNRELSLSWK